MIDVWDVNDPDPAEKRGLILKRKEGTRHAAPPLLDFSTRLTDSRSLRTELHAAVGVAAAGVGEIHADDLGSLRLRASRRCQGRTRRDGADGQP